MLNMTSGLLSLKWNNHKSTFFHVLSSIRLKESYCDATLACEGKFYSVHKLILSTCSEYFEQIFERTQCKHPVIVLKDIKSEDLEALMNYMYVGEVNVMQEKLGSLIKAAECLKIKGLAVPDEDPVSDRQVRSQQVSSEPKSPSAKRRKRDYYSSDLPYKPDISHRNATSEKDQRDNDLETSQYNVDSLSESQRLEEKNIDSENHPSRSNSSKQRKGNESSDQSSSSKNSILEIFLNPSDVKSEPPDIEEEVIDIKESIKSSVKYPSMGDKDSAVNDGANDDGSAFAEMLSDNNANEDGDQAMPSTSSDYQGNSFPSWEGEGSLPDFPNEGYNEENSDQRAMVMVNSFSTSAHEIDIPTSLSNKMMQHGRFMDIRDTRHCCPYCMKSSATKRDLDRHILTHTGEKPFPCPFCSYRSSRRDKQKAHIRRLHLGDALPSQISSNTNNSSNTDANIGFILETRTIPNESWED